MAPQMTGPRAMTRAEQDAFTLHVQRTPLEDIEKATTLSRPRIAAAVDLAQVHAKLSARPAAAPPVPAKPLRLPARRLPAPHDLVEKNRVLTATIEVLREHIAKCEAELAALRCLQPAPMSEVVNGPAIEELAVPSEDLAESDEVREWAQAEGWHIPAEGRLPGGIVAAYIKARGGVR